MPCKPLELLFELIETEEVLVLAARHARPNFCIISCLLRLLSLPRLLRIDQPAPCASWTWRFSALSLPLQMDAEHLLDLQSACRARALRCLQILRATSREELETTPSQPIPRPTPAANHNNPAINIIGIISGCVASIALSKKGYVVYRMKLESQSEPATLHPEGRRS